MNKEIKVNLETGLKGTRFENKTCIIKYSTTFRNEHETSTIKSKSGEMDRILLLDDKITVKILCEL